MDACFHSFEVHNYLYKIMVIESSKCLSVPVRFNQSWQINVEDCTKFIFDADFIAMFFPSAS